MSFVERFIILCPYLGESTIGGPTVVTPAIGGKYFDAIPADSHQILYPLFAVPLVGPAIIRTVRTNATTAIVTWAVLGNEIARGNVTSYSAKYRRMKFQTELCSASNASSWSVMAKTTPATTLSIAELDPSSGYCVAVAATTSAGTGPYGTPATIQGWPIATILHCLMNCLDLSTDQYPISETVSHAKNLNTKRMRHDIFALFICSCSNNYHPDLLLWSY